MPRCHPPHASLRVILASCRPYAVQDQSAFARDRHELGRAATRHSASAMISKAAPERPASGSIPAQADAQAGCYIMDVLCYLHSRPGKGAPQQLPLHPAAISPSLHCSLHGPSHSQYDRGLSACILSGVCILPPHPLKRSGVSKVKNPRVACRRSFKIRAFERACDAQNV